MDELQRQLTEIAEKISRIDHTINGNPDARGLKAMVIDLWEDRERRRKWMAGVKASLVVSAICGLAAWVWSRVHFHH